MLMGKVIRQREVVGYVCRGSMVENIRFWGRLDQNILEYLIMNKMESSAHGKNKGGKRKKIIG